MLTNIDTGAYVRGYVVRGEGLVATLADYAGDIARNRKYGGTRARNVGLINRYPERSRVVQVEWLEDSGFWRGFRALVVGNGWMLELDASAPRAKFAASEQELRTIFESLRIPDEELRAPVGLTPVVGSIVENSDPPFALEVQGAGWHALDLRSRGEHKSGAREITWKQPYRNIILSVWVEPAVAADATPAALIDKFLASLRADALAPARVQPRAHPHADRAALVEFELDNGKMKRAMWSVIVVRGNDALFGMIEAEPDDRDQLALDALATLRSLDFLQR